MIFRTLPPVTGDDLLRKKTRHETARSPYAAATIRWAATQWASQSEPERLRVIDRNSCAPAYASTDPNDNSMPSANASQLKPPAGLTAPCVGRNTKHRCPAHLTRAAEHLRSHRRRTSIAARKWLRQPGSTAPSTRSMPPIPPAQTLRSKRPLREIATPTKRSADLPTRRIHAITSGGSSPPKPAQQHDPQTKTPP